MTAMKFDKSLPVRRNPPTTFAHFHPFLVPAAQMLVLRGSSTESRLILRRQTSQYAVKNEAMEERDFAEPISACSSSKVGYLGDRFSCSLGISLLDHHTQVCLLPSVWIWKLSYCPHAQNCCQCESFNITLAAFSELLLCLLYAFSLEQSLRIFVGYFLCLFENDLGSFWARTLGWL